VSGCSDWLEVSCREGTIASETRLFSSSDMLSGYRENTSSCYSALYRVSYNRINSLYKNGMMVDPVTAATVFSANKIAKLAFTKFIDSGASKLAEKFTEAAIVKMDDLRKKIWAKLRGKSPKIDEALTKAEQGDRSAVDTVAKYLDVEMENNSDFAAEIRAIAHEIALEQYQDNSTMSQINYGGINYQTKTGDSNTNFFGGTHNHGQQ
jgi:hypothetical protein